MISCDFFYNSLLQRGVDFFTGVPDSLLGSFCAYVTGHTTPERHVIAANEGGAVAIACGHYLATGNVALVYMQNSGQGNAINPLLSLADRDVYSIPMLLLVGWRGEPGKKDEPEHVKQGKVTLSLFDTLGIPYRVLPDADDEVEHCLSEILDISKSANVPVALVAKKSSFNSYEVDSQPCSFGLTREEAIKVIVDKLEPSDIVVSTTGKTSRELYEYRDQQLAGDHSRDFLNVGSMGHTSQIALGIALAKPARQVFCLDGDGAAIMHMGALAIIGSQKPRNFKHIIINNGAHDSVGGQPTVGFSILFTDIAKACGYEVALRAESLNEISQKMEVVRPAQGPVLLEVKVRKGARADLGRPKIPPEKNKADFMKFLSS